MKLKRENIVCFWKVNEDYGYLSQWYPSIFTIEGVTYQNAEQFMMAEKAKLFNDLEVANEIITSKLPPREYKKLGRKVKNFSTPLWLKHRYAIVLKGTLAKFEQNPELWKQLNATGDKLLIEASPFDENWGVHLAESDTRILDTDTWQGENLLGKALMEAKDILRKKYCR